MVTDILFFAQAAHIAAAEFGCRRGRERGPRAHHHGSVPRGGRHAPCASAALRTR